MSRGFFSSEETTARVSLPTIPQCGACGLYKQCQSPKMEPYGKGRKKIMVVGSFPDDQDDTRESMRRNRAFYELELTLDRNGIEKHDCVWTSAMICHPKDDGKLWRKQVEYCRPNVFNAIAEHKPKAIILLGDEAIKSVLGKLYKNNPGNSDQWKGFTIPSQELNSWVCPVVHPSFFTTDKRRAKTAVVERLLFEQHIAKAVEVAENYPWETVPDFKKQVKLLWNADEVDAEITAMYEDGKPVSFDYETNMLKPHNANSYIRCVSLSNSKRTIAFEWNKSTMRSVRSILRDPNVPKIAANMKFEYSWTLAKLGFEIRNWLHDPILGMHVIDNRPLICGLKFQSFVEYGLPKYNRDIERYLRSGEKGCYAPNRVGDANLEALMLYCGLDALLAYKISMRQRKLLGLPLYHPLQRS